MLMGFSRQKYCRGCQALLQSIPTDVKPSRGMVGPKFLTTCIVVKSVLWRKTPRIAREGLPKIYSFMNIMRTLT